MQHRSGYHRSKQQEGGQGMPHPEQSSLLAGCGETGTVILFQVRKLSSQDPHKPGFHI